MSRIFVYCLAPNDQSSIGNQLQEIAAAGFDAPPFRVIKEAVSGGLSSCERLAFNSLMRDELLGGDTLVVTRLKCLGRNAMDVVGTVEELAFMNIRVHCLAVGKADLTSADGKATMDVIAAVAEFERDLLVERTQAGLARAKSEGKVLGRPRALTDAQEADELRLLAGGASISEVARTTKTSRPTIMRLRDRSQ